MTEEKDMRFIKRMAAQDYIDKTREYLDYVEEHIENVRMSFVELNDKCQGQWWIVDDETWHTLRNQIEYHDISKLSAAELVQYRDKFYPVDGEKVGVRVGAGMPCGIDDQFSNAWEHHKECNSHHHEVVKDHIDVLHMVIDWMAMSLKFGDTPRQYYEANKDRIKLSDEHKKLMIEVFDCLEVDHD